MAFEFKMPDIGEGVVEGEIVKWHVRPGQEVKEDDPLVEVMTDKATVLIPSPRKGKILETIGEEGGIVKVGAIMLTLDTGDGSAQSVSAPTPAKKEPVSKIVEKAEASPEKSGNRSLATPAVRKIAQEMGVDINQVTGSGPGGRVSREDIVAYAGTSKSGAGATSEREPLRVYTGKEETEEVPLRGLRKKVAEKMVQSKQHAPHYTYVDEIDMTEMVKLRGAANELVSKTGAKLSYLPFLMKAVIAGLKKYPLLNATLDEAKGKIILKHFYNIGIGVATPEGLTVVVIKHADQKSIPEIAQEITRLSEAARDNRASLEDLRGSTITLTSLGLAGGIFATPIINYPEVAIIGIHKIEPRAVVRNSQIVIREMMNLSLSFDHRVVDGAVGAEFCGYIKKFLESPALLFMQL